MFFVIAKTVGAMVQGLNFLVLCIALGAVLSWTRYRAAGRLVATAGGFALALFAFTPATEMLARPLEDRFPQPALAEAPTGIIVLGGSVDEVLTRQRGQVALNAAAERLTEAVALSRRFPAARLVFSGGSGRLSPHHVTESDAVREFWLSMGVPAERMTFEDRSRDTWENALYTRELVKPKPGERWLLVTSAMHMPRSVGIFRKLDFPVIPYPVDYQTGGVAADFEGFRQAQFNLPVFDTASHEWIGLVAYYFAGKTSALFPAP
ncbi:MAG: YdcF family protein [Hyphomicrobiales bacterium]|nr:YdcF family protein [Hyphomicrobiales bacterium]